MLHNLIIRYS